MNSLNDLNQLFDTVVFDDDRAPAIIFDRVIPVNQTLNFNEGQIVTLPNGIEIAEIIGFEDIGCTVTFNVSNIPGSTLSWNNLPEGVEPEILSPGVYRLGVVTDSFFWNQIKNPMLTPPIDFFGSYSFTVTINYSSSLSKVYTISGEIFDVEEWTVPQDHWFPLGQATVTNTPKLRDSANPIESWRVFVFPSNPNLVSLLTTSGTGGSVTFNSETKSLTINGTNAQINSHLNTLVMVSNSTEHFQLTYTAQNIADLSSDTINQNMRSSVIRYFTIPQSQVIQEDQPTAVVGQPLITNIEYTSDGSYTVVVNVTNFAIAIKNITSNGTGGTTFYDAQDTRNYTITGTKTQVNSHLSTLQITPATDWDENFQLDYNIFPPIVNTPGLTTVVQNFSIDSHPEAENFSLARNYLNNQSNLIFANNAPVITDLDPSATTYTIQLNLNSSGTLSAPGGLSGSEIFLQGTKSQVNALLPQVSFTPASGQFQSTTFSYRQTKNSDVFPFTTIQIEQFNIPLIGPGVAFSTPTAENQSITVSEGSQHFVPVGVDVLGINDYAETLPVYTIDVSAVANTVVEWLTIPNGCFVTLVSPGVYRISGITSKAVWDQIKSPRITLDNKFNGVFNYTATISWNNFTNNLGWIVETTVQEVVPLSQPSNITYFSGTTRSLPVVTLTDVGSLNPTWTVDITASKNFPGTLITSGGSGGTVSWNDTLKRYRIQGSVTQVNSHLSSLILNPTAGYDFDYSLTYYAFNNLNDETDTKIQQLTSNNFTVLDAVRSQFNYTTSGTVTVNGGPLITDAANSGLGQYTMDIKPNDVNSVTNIFADGSAFIKTVEIEPSILLYDYFEYTLSGDSNRLAVIGSETVGAAPQIKIYVKNSGSWVLEHTFSNLPFDVNEQSDYDRFVLKFSYNGDYLAVGNPSETVNSVGEVGAVWIYERSGLVWQFQQRLVPTQAQDILTKVYFGASLSFDTAASTLLIGAPGGARFAANSPSFAYVFSKPVSTWNVHTILRPVDDQWPFTGSSIQFGRNAVISGDGNTLAISEIYRVDDFVTRGNILIYIKVSNVWTKQYEFNSEGSRINSDIINLDLSSNGNVLVASNYWYDNNNTTNTNTDDVEYLRLRFFSRSGSNWSITNTFTTSIAFGDINRGDKLSNYRYFSINLLGNKISFLNSRTTIQDPNIIDLLLRTETIHTYELTGGTWNLINISELNSKIISPPNRENRIIFSKDGRSIIIKDDYKPQPYQAQSDLFQIEVYAVSDISFNNTTKTLTIISTRPQINTLIDLLQVTIAPGYNQSFELEYTATTPNSAVSRRNQRVNKI